MYISMNIRLETATSRIASKSYNFNKSNDW